MLWRRGRRGRGRTEKKLVEVDSVARKIRGSDHRGTLLPILVTCLVDITWESIAYRREWYLGKLFSSFFLRQCQQRQNVLLKWYSSEENYSDRRLRGARRRKKSERFDIGATEQKGTAINRERRRRRAYAEDNLHSRENQATKSAFISCYSIKCLFCWPKNVVRCFVYIMSPK